jgi:hypothetical protein
VAYLLVVLKLRGIGVTQAEAALQILKVKTYGTHKARLVAIVTPR